ncbi:hypothetical protein CFP56_034792 [Quercus suber]|uniref:Transmembrane protein n=1 Tax=Quercus suber TaxID=58331 RepID=A0AAW0LQ99_QUESU
MAWVGGFCEWRELVGRRWLVWFDGGLGLMVGFVPLGLVSSLSRSSSDGGFKVLWGERSQSFDGCKPKIMPQDSTIE